MRMKTTKQTMLKKKAKQLCCILLAAMLCMGNDSTGHGCVIKV